ncbi:MAG: helix-turn-helix transcriptional regulator [Candidatus Nanohaloarchaeota archaeon QJJ-5]|nr:helix-turn-helix transcriptional regulator [Candidatus Nanohaloarchaeota archaeon QJJ-5]
MAIETELRTLRNANDITQAELAKEVGVSRQTINAIETGKYNPSLELALKLATYFETTVEDIFSLQDER